MFELKSSKPLELFEKQERFRPSARKHILELSDHTIYESRELQWEDHFGVPILTDFGLARFGQIKYTDTRVQPLQYQSPEVIMKMGWDRKIDIWNLGCLVHNMLTNDTFFKGIDEKVGVWTARRHLREMIELIGMPPPTFVLRAGILARLIGFDEHGYWIGGMIDWSGIEERVPIPNEDGKALIVGFLYECLQWRPEDRATPFKLLETTWMSAVDA